MKNNETSPNNSASRADIPSEADMNRMWNDLQKTKRGELKSDFGMEPVSVSNKRENGKAVEGSEVHNAIIGLIEEPQERNSFDRIIILPETLLSLENCLAKVELTNFIFEKWDLKSIEPLESKNVLNMYGPPGTGKTMAAKAIAQHLKKRILIVDYAQLTGSLVGDTEKNISKMFRLATEEDLIIFLDEGDTLASKRTSDDSSQARHINSSKNVFMQELDKFNGLVILTTNLFENFDPALLRRMQNVEFKLPNEEMREKIINLHIPKAIPLGEDVDFKELAKLTDKFSGGDIKNVTKEAIVAAANEFNKLGKLAEAKLERKHLVKEIEKIKANKMVHTGEIHVKTIGLV